jgi:hypothetical protein
VRLSKSLPAALVAVSLTPAAAPAQTPPAASVADPAQRSKPPVRRGPLRLQVSPPGGEYYRHCIGGYAVEHRATGDTIVPRLQCWWARGK